MSVTLQAAVRLGNDYAENLHCIKNKAKGTLKQIFNVIEKLIRDQKDLRYPCDQLAADYVAKDNFSLLTRQFSLRLQKRMSSPIQYCVWEESVLNQLKHGRRRLIGFLNSRPYKELDRIDWEPMQFEWQNFPGFTTRQIFAEIHNMMTELKCELEQFTGTNHLHVNVQCHCMKRKKNEELCIANFKTVARYATRFAQGTVVVSRAWIRKEMVRVAHVQAEWRTG